MPFSPNYLRKLLDEGKPTFSVHQLIVDPAITEILGHIGGIDYIEFVAEYATYDPTFLDTRDDDYIDLNVGYRFEFDEHWSLLPTIRYSNNDSNIITSDYDRFSFMVTVRNDF